MNMMRKAVSTLIGLALMSASAAYAVTAPSIDTGTPTGSGFPLALDGTDWLAGQISFSQASTIQSIQAYLNDGGNGGTFTIALYDDTSAHLPGAELVSWSNISAGTAGWYGVANLNQAVSAGNYWVALEVRDNGFNGTADVGVLNPLAKYAFNAGGYQGYEALTGSAFGLQVTAVPEPESYAMLLAGLGLLGFAARRRAR
jgi:hypothetical protein